jgi:DNA-directed RNA polymerase specialized sigma24 family protein
LIQANLDSDQFEQQNLTSQEIESVLRGFSDADWARASKMAEFYSHNVPGITSDDLLQTAIVKFLSGFRRWPEKTAPLVVLSKVLKSIANGIRKKEDRVFDPNVQIQFSDDEDLREVVEPVDETSIPDKLFARNLLQTIEQLVQGDEIAELVLMAWAEGLRGIEAAEATGLTAKEYDAARKRLDRKLAPLKELWSEQ